MRKTIMTIAMLAVVLMMVPASAQVIQGEAPSGGFDSSATTDRPDRDTKTAALTAAASEHQYASAGALEELGASTTFAQSDCPLGRADDSAGDAGTLDGAVGLTVYCAQDNSVAGGLLTNDSWGDSSLGYYDWYIDVDGDPTNSCSGFEYNAYAFHEPGQGILAGLFRTATCDNPVLLEGIAVGRPSPDAFNVGFDAALIGSPAQVISIMDIDGLDEASRDVVPDSGAWVVARDGSSAPQPAPSEPAPPASTARTIERLAGPSRIDTSIAISRYQFPNGAAEVYLSRADEFADSISSGSLTRGPVLLVPQCGPVPQQILDEVVRLNPTKVVPLGGTAAVCDQVAIDIANAGSTTLTSTR